MGEAEAANNTPAESPGLKALRALRSEFGNVTATQDELSARVEAMERFAATTARHYVGFLVALLGLTLVVKAQRKQLDLLAEALHQAQ